MILETKNKPPFIHFGFNQISKTIELGQVVEVWQDNLYSDELEITSTTVTKVNENHFTIEPVAIGTINIKVTLSTKTTKAYRTKLRESIDSNTITLTVIVRLTIDSSITKVDNNIITVDNV